MGKSKITEWKWIPEYKGIYLASTLGEIKSVNRIVNRTGGLNHTVNGKVLIASIRNGYRFVSLCKDGNPKKFKVSILIAMTFLKHKPNGYNGLFVDHINEIRHDDRLVNLQLLTNRENLSRSKKNKTSQYTGICWDKARGQWKSAIKIDYKSIHLGYFHDEDDAGKIYINKLKELTNE